MFFLKRRALIILLIVFAALCVVATVAMPRIVTDVRVERLLCPAGGYHEGQEATLIHAGRTYLVFLAIASAALAVLVWLRRIVVRPVAYLLLILLAGLGLRLACVFLFDSGPNVRFSVHFVETMNAGRSPYIHDQLHYPPLHLLYLQMGNAVSRVTGMGLGRAVRLPWVAFDVLSALLVYLILKQRGAAERTALFGAAVLALSPYVIATSSYDGSCDCSWFFWTLLAFYLLQRRSDLRGVLASALVLGIGIASKPIPLLALPAFVLTRKCWRDRVLYGVLALVPVFILTAGHLAYENGGFYGHLISYSGGGYGICGIPAFVKMLLKIDAYANVASLHALARFCQSYGDWLWKAALVLVWLVLGWRRDLANLLVATFAIVLALTMHSFPNYFVWLLPFLLIDEDSLAAPYAVLTAVYGFVIPPLFLYLDGLGMRDLYLRELFSTPVWVVCAMAAVAAVSGRDLFAAVERAFTTSRSRLFTSFRSRPIRPYTSSGAVRRFVAERREFVIAVIFLVAFFVRILYVVDNRAYHCPQYHENGTIARNLITGRGYAGGAHLGPAWTTPVFLGRPEKTAFMSPGYPLILAGYFATIGERNPEALLAFQCLLGALTCVLLFRVALRATKRPDVAALAGLLAALSYFMIQTSSWMNVAVYTSFFLMLLVWLVQANREFPSYLKDAGIGALWGAAALVEPVVLSFFPFALLWMRWPKRFVWKRKLISWAICIFFAALVISPWTVRNAVVFRKLVPLKSAWWYNFWRGNNPYATGGDRREKDKSSPQYLSTEEFTEIKSMGNEIDRFDYLKRKAFDFIRENPGTFLKLRGKSIVFFWTGQNMWHGFAWAPEHPVTLPLNILLFAFAFVGMGVAIRRRMTGMRLIFLLLLTFPIPYYLCHSDIQYRYRMPMDPFLILFGALAIVAALDDGRDTHV